MSPESTLRDGNAAFFELIETMRWEPGGGFLRGDRHLARLQASAEALDFAYDRTSIEVALAQAAGGETPHRVRLALSVDGGVDVTTQTFTSLASDAIWTLRIAETRLNADDPLLRHKTTRRAAYDAARAEFSREEADEVILLNEAGDVCEGTITSVFVDMGDGGPLKTPALTCGLLAGVLRGELLEAGKAAEMKLTVADLSRAKIMFVGNSLRGLIAAKLA